MTSVGLFNRAITWAAVKVLPVPVAPSSVWYLTPDSMLSTSFSMAWGWSPWGENSETSSNFLPLIPVSLIISPSQPSIADINHLNFYPTVSDIETDKVTNFVKWEYLFPYIILVFKRGCN
ncbi:hypothetical protein D3C71_1819980 [compost metagenome]